MPNNLPNKVNRKENGKKGNGDVEELGRVGPIEREPPCLSASAGFLGTPRMNVDGGCCREKSTRKGKVLERIVSGKGYHYGDSVCPKKQVQMGKWGQKMQKSMGKFVLFFPRKLADRFELSLHRAFAGACVACVL